MASTYNYEYFNVTFPGEYVAQVEINRPEKMNAFNDTYVRAFFLTINYKYMHEPFIISAINNQLAHVYGR